MIRTEKYQDWINETAKREKLYELCRDFIDDQELSNLDEINKCYWNLEFINSICKLIGWYNQEST